jgi:hypothetical protein
MMAAQPHRKITGPDGGAGLGANIRVNQWGFARLFFCDETRLHQLVYQSLLDIMDTYFGTTFLPSGIYELLIGCRWVFKRKYNPNLLMRILRSISLQLIIE